MIPIKSKMKYLLVSAIVLFAILINFKKDYLLHNIFKLRYGTSSSINSIKVKLPPKWHFTSVKDSVLTLSTYPTGNIKLPISLVILIDEINKDERLQCFVDNSLKDGLQFDTIQNYGNKLNAFGFLLKDEEYKFIRHEEVLIPSKSLKIVVHNVPEEYRKNYLEVIKNLKM